MAHWHRLQRLVGNLTEHGRSVEANFRTIGRRVARAPRCAVVPDHIVQRRHQIGITQPLDDDPEDVRDHAVYRTAIDAHDRPDPDGGRKCGPEVELVRRVRAALGGHHAAERCGGFR